MKHLIFFAVLTTLSMLSPAVAEESAKFQITIMWPGDSDADVDMTILAPDEPEVVGFKRKQGRYIRLLRDELGVAMRTGSPNPPAYFETAMTDMRRPGEYVINVRPYIGRTFPVTVTVLVDKISEFGSAVRQLQATVSLDALKQEKTIASFIVDSSGKIKPGSANQIFRQLVVENRSFFETINPNIWTR